MASVSDAAGAVVRHHVVAAAQTAGPDVYAIDTTHHSVVRFSGGLSGPVTVATGFGEPGAMVLDRHNNAYVVDVGTRQLIRVAVGSGTKRVLRSNLSIDGRYTSIAVDGSGDVYLLDGRSIVEYNANTAVASTRGTAGIAGQLTVDGPGNVSVTGTPEPGSDGPLVVETHAVAGTVTTRAVLESLGGGSLQKVSETPGGALYLWLRVGGASGAESIVRLGPGATTLDDVSTANGDFMDAVDRSGNYYLMQTRRWCVWPAVISGTCADDFAVDAIAKFAPPRAPSVSTAVTGVSLPLGGFAVDDAGNLYAAEVPFHWEPAGLNVPPAQLIRVGANGARSVLGTGNYQDPVVASTAPGRAVTTAVTVSGSRATITWSAPSSNGGSPITGYRLSRNGTDSKGTGPWSTVVPATARAATFGNLIPGVTYALSVQAINGIGTGPAAPTTVRLPLPPGGSRSLTLVVSAGTHSATVGWAPPADDGGSPVTAYRVSRDGLDSAGTGPWSTVVPATARAYTFQRLIPGRTYILQVTAINAAGTGISASVKAGV